MQMDVNRCDAEVEKFVNATAQVNFAVAESTSIFKMMAASSFAVSFCFPFFFGFLILRMVSVWRCYRLADNWTLGRFVYIYL